MTYEELFHSLCACLEALSLTQRAVCGRFSDTHVVRAVDATMDAVDKFVQNHKDREKEMLNKMAEDYEAEERREEEEFNLPYKIMDDESPG